MLHLILKKINEGDILGVNSRITLAVFCLLCSCVSTGPSVQLAGTDSPLVLSTLDLFSQAIPPKAGKSWQGDWEFRRDRLDLVDSGLRDVRPDIAIFQNALARSGSTSESDHIILAAGALARYEWRDVVIDTLKESGEDRTLAVAVAKPFYTEPEPPNAERSYWQMGADGHLAFFTLGGVTDPILIVDVLMPSKRDQVGLWYSFAQERIMERVAQRKICLSRIIVAGYLPSDLGNRKSREFMEALNLRDTAAGFCQNAERCQTATLTNELFALTHSDGEAGHVDRILVHGTATILSAGLAFTQSVDSTQYKEIYGVSRILASVRFGWTTRVRLAACSK